MPALPQSIGTIASASFLVLTLLGCRSSEIPPPESLLTEKQIQDLLHSPRRWHHRVVTMRIFPFDHGFPTSYAACFNPCDASQAVKQPIVIFTRPNRFRGYNGDQAVVVKARFNACFNRSRECLEPKYGVFREQE
jgi:hypothetical protein